MIEAGLLDKLLLSPVCSSGPRADELAAALYRSARYFCSCDAPHCTRRYKNIPPDNGCPKGGMRISCRADVVLWKDPADGIKKYRVQFRLFDKRESVRHVVQKYGPDPNKWPYYARRKQLKGTA